jgi:hypothetical protein
MLYTFRDAKRILANAAHSSSVDIGQKINDAVRALCSLNPHEHELLRQVVRLFSASPVISLPQGSAGLVRACVNGRPVTMRGQDFQFLSSGPGDFTGRAQGYRHKVANFTDLGVSPTWYSIHCPGRLAVRCKGTELQPPVTIHAVDNYGDSVKFQLNPIPEQSTEAPKFSETVVQSIEHVILDDHTSDYLTLLFDNGQGQEPAVLARYHPKVKIPEFRQYMLDVPFAGPFDVLAEVQIEPMELVDDDDVLPFPSLEPVKCMMKYEWHLQNDEGTAADHDLKSAMQWLAMNNNVKNVMQTPTVLNVPYVGSTGQMSNFYRNL